MVAHPAPKLFVLDTNVLLHDPTCLFQFQEHDVFLPMMTIEELDHNKKGMTEVARNARQVSRFLDEIITRAGKVDISQGISLARAQNPGPSGTLFLQTLKKAQPTTLLADEKPDNQILAVALELQRSQPKRAVILVSKDINMRIKARALGVDAEDYFNDKVLEDTDLLYTGVRELPDDFWETHGKDMQSWQEQGRTLYKVEGPLVP
ncbi:MAG: PhoH family protein, partial [Ferrovum sp.]|nr:PhoH family protein [Ferrovum sp.]